MLPMDEAAPGGMGDKMDHMDAAVTEVFERMLWQSCKVAHVDCGGEERITAWIELKGSPEGRCGVEVPVCAGDQLTDALLGSEGDWDDALIEDAVGELCNMITGVMKTRMVQNDAECRISVPVVSRLKRADFREISGQHAGLRRLYWFSEGSTLAVTLELERQG